MKHHSIIPTFRGLRSIPPNSGKEELFVFKFALKKACNREKKPWVNYVIEQEDGQTIRTSKTDRNLRRR